MTFAEGERALLLDDKDRRYLVTLKAGAQFHTHKGYLSHDDIIGEPPGTRVKTTTGTTFIAVRPSLTDFVLKMPRGAQVIYPKDIAQILMNADIFPGAEVLEAGTGSGALTIGMLRAIGPAGRLITVDRREEFHEKAKENIVAFTGSMPAHLDMRVGDVVEIDPGPVDRIVLDLPEPWRVIPMTRKFLRPGGIFCSYVPSIVQVSQTTEALVQAGGFIEVTTTETLVRSWHVEGTAVRPDHRMVAHTGFITTARMLEI